MSKAETPARVTQRYTSAEFRPYVKALGELALAWNELQERLGVLFWVIMLNQSGRPSADNPLNYRPIKVWHAIRSDRSQRDMLRAAVNDLDSAMDWGRPNFREDIKWLLSKVEQLEDARNDAVHSPLFMTRSIFRLFVKISINEIVAPASFTFNPRAIKLEKRESLLREFRFCRDMALALADYSSRLDSALADTERVWPDRPLLPSRKPRSSHRGQPGRSPPITVG